MLNSVTEYIQKNNEKRNKKLKYDFMPSLLEIIERPSHIAGTVIVAAIAALLIAVITWSYFSKIDVVVNASGNIIPDGRNIDIQSVIGGKVKSINVKNGDFITAGQVLIELQDDDYDMNMEQLNYNIKWCKIRTEIANERLKNDEYTFDISKYSEYTHGLISMKRDIENYIERKESIKDRKLEEEEYLKEIEYLQKNLNSQLHNELFSLEREMNGYDTQLIRYEHNAENYLITSPVDGYVNMLTVSAAGQAITTVNAVISIVPSGKETVFECYIPDKDRSEIEFDMNVNLKLSAYNFSDYGAVTGKITYISPSAFSSEKLGNVYAVTVNINKDDLNPKIDLTYGLSGNAEIVIGKRSVLQYFLEPITKGLGESLKEK